MQDWQKAPAGGTNSSPRLTFINRVTSAGRHPLRRWMTSAALAMRAGAIYPLVMGLSKHDPSQRVVLRPFAYTVNGRQAQDERRATAATARSR
jgi:hypothetical protein